VGDYISSLSNTVRALLNSTGDSCTDLDDNIKHKGIAVVLETGDGYIDNY
jgi:hypothetical protein